MARDDRLRPIDPAEAASWRAWVKGPHELEIRCSGGALARLATVLHQRWPFARGHARANAWLRHAGPFCRGQFVTPSGVSISLDVGTDQFLHLSGRLPTEPLEVSLLSRLVREGDVVVDVGAHWGLYVAHLLGRIAPSGVYHAFEPSPSHLALLRKIFGAADRLILHECALSDHDGVASLLSETSAIAHIDTSRTTGTAVPVRRMDQVLAGERRDCHWLLKIDVEGHEQSVLRGGDALFQDGLRPTVMLDYLPTLTGAERESLEETLTSLFVREYSWFAICQTHGTLHGFHGRDPTAGGHEVLNLLLVPDEQMHRVRSAFVTPIEASRARKLRRER